MPTFAYKAKTRSGELVDGTVTAGDRRLALVQLGRMGYFPLAVEVSDGRGGGAKPALSASMTFSFRERMTSRDVLVFTQQLCSLLRSGMQLSDALTTLARRAQKTGVREVLDGVRADIVEGANLSDALARYPKLFSRLYVNLVRAGEASGTLAEILERLAHHYESVGEIREKVVSALIYPLIIIGVGVVTIIFFMTVMVPKFADMFRDMGRTMPLPTRMLIGISDLVVGYWWIPVILMVVGVVLLRQRMASVDGRLQLDGWTLRMPVIGSVITLSAFGHFARTLATLLENGVPVLTALQIVEDTMGNRVIAREIGQARTRVTDGTSISQPLAKGKIFPPLLIDMLAVGEASGSVVPSLQNIADTYDRELTHKLRVMTTLLEPVIIIFMALIVGSVVLSVLMAVFEITSGIGA